MDTGALQIKQIRILQRNIDGKGWEEKMNTCELRWKQHGVTSQNRNLQANVLSSNRILAKFPIL